ncbi:MAG: hypothetical protein Q9214_005326 [Letrouitia sp. 1 TL-2023]
MSVFHWGFANSLLAISFCLCFAKWFLRTLLGQHLRRKSATRKSLILARVKTEENQSHFAGRESPKSSDDGEWEKIEASAAGSAANGGQADDEWEGVVGFFHPFCNAGGGGERVLWAAIRATQQRWPRAICAVYTGDRDVTKEEILERVQNRFNIHLHPPTIVFLYLYTRRYVLSTTFPRFTLLGQSLGSLILAYDAFSILIPDIFIDTMGYAFTLAFSKFLFPSIPTAAYVHYPTISTDMLGSLDADSKDGKGLNAGAGKGMRGLVKRKYWHLFAWLYGQVGGDVDVVMTNSSWTQEHIQNLWGPSRIRRKKTSPVDVVFPPVAVRELERAIEINEESERKRKRVLLCIAQFRPEKNHSMLLRAFALMRQSNKSLMDDAKLVLIGSVRDSDDATRVYDLRLLAHELKIKDQVEFATDASWPSILDHLRRSWVGVNGMWNEHFGIGVVEYQAAGLISVVNDSGGPKLDIVVDMDGRPTGFYASTVVEYAAKFAEALLMVPDEALAMRSRARTSAMRFTEEEFAARWSGQMEKLVGLTGVQK